MNEFLSPRHFHVQELESLCVAALAAGDARTAFKYIDRRCRISPLAQAHHYVLRAEALSRMGEDDGAVADLATALALAPDNLQANRRMLSLGKGAAQLKAAQALIAHEHESSVLIQALALLKRHGERAVASVRVFDSLVAGWIAWEGRASIGLTIAGESDDASMEIIHDPSHGLVDSGFPNHASFEFARPDSRFDLSIAASGQREPLFRKSIPGRPSFNSRSIASEEAKSVAETFKSGESPEVTVIVPIYRDFRATRACLDSLTAELAAAKNCHAILVDDASPDHRIRSHLERVSNDRNVMVVNNAVNLGFVGAVNRALGLAPKGDVILLNADTVVPRGFISRLAAIARADPKIGTITPISNNGEFTSFPVAYRANPMPKAGEIAAIDKVASSVNKEPIEIPNGIGFCLYITRACLEKIGLLSATYQRGYFEDVELCLRAREHGFRNVCAPSVFVGHVGTLSFGSDKRSLVVQNLGILETKFPNYRTECATFILADPLRPARASIELAMPPNTTFDRLLVTRAGLLRAVTEQRSQELIAAQKSCLLLIVDDNAIEPSVEIKSPVENAPQSLRFRIDSATERAALRRYLSELKFTRIEMCDLAKISTEIAELLVACDKPIDLFIGNASLLCPCGSLALPNGKICRSAATGKPSRLCTNLVSRKDKGAASAEKVRARLRSKIEKIIAPCDISRAIASFAAPGKKILSSRLAARPMRVHDSISSNRHGVCGIVTTGLDIEEFALIQDITRFFVRRWPSISFVAIGRGLDELALMATGNVFVTGSALPQEYKAMVRRYDLSRLFLATRQALFGHPSHIAAMDTALPRAYFDWSFGAVKARPGDLPLDPKLDHKETAVALSRWLVGGR